MLRVVVLVNAVALNLWRADNFAHPVAGALCVALMLAWTGVALWAYAAPARRTPLLLVLDLAVAVALVLLSPVVKGDGMQATVPGFWVMGALLAWAVHWRWLGGLVAGLVLAAADLAVRTELTQANYGNVFLLLIGGPVVGFMSGSLQQMADERDQAERAAAAAAERARLARAVHDGVLQVLALVQRRGAELGGEAAELGRLAGEQEAALRTLVRNQDAVGPAPAGVDRPTDLAAALARLEATRPVSVAAPADAVPLPAPVARELVAVVEACLDNVARHVGPDAHAWVLLESLPDRLELSVRDEGPGIPAGRLAEAEREGRLGVVESIRGRVVDLGGTATLTTGSFGTEWEICVPRP
ncbi:MacS family sensor histidine kinase [Nocardioides sp. MAHUQ-72]|uniref:MacS family sensor histidine kinase n=1 Tax=unclassified Nocardioides TaxID=2615069 RepID=UPI003606F1B2